MSLPRSAVVTIVHGRHRHLLRQRSHLAAGSQRPDLHVVVAMDDDEVAGLLERPIPAPHLPRDGAPIPTVVLPMAAGPVGLPLAAARNAGAAEAIRRGADVLVFLDVDCLPARECIVTYLEAAAAPETSTAVLCGPVTYLPPGAADDADLTARRDPHPARPDPAPGASEAADPDLFWSLSFALTSQTWTRIGGFCEEYSGYGAEDTDFAHTARAAGTPIRFLGGADAYHQHHPTMRPPLQHRDDLLRNGAVFARRWGRWPMPGWFADLRRLRAVEAVNGSWRTAAPIRVLSVPDRHPYVEAVRPATVVPARPGRVEGWDPDPALTPEYLRAHRSEVDVLHLHFGFEHLTTDELRQWCRAAQECALPLVMTVHDLRNPHCPDNTHHEEQLTVLTRRARELTTLTDGAADEFHARYGRRPRVIGHPSLAVAGPAGPTRPGLVTLHLKSLRTNVGPPARLVRAAYRGAEAGGGLLRVDLHSDSAADPRLAGVHDLARQGRIELAVHPRYSDEELQRHLQAAHVSVLPHRFGTHSGWLELCRDLGTRVVAPDCGYYGQQWDEVVTYRHNERDGLDEQSLADAVTAALSTPPPAPMDPDTRTDRDWQIRLAHAEIYARALS